MEVLLNNFTRQWEVIRDDVLAGVERVGASGRYILGTEVQHFEAQLSQLWGMRFAIGVGNGLDALEIALRAAGVRPGERVLTTPLSAFATTLAVVRAGGVPVFVDVDHSGLIDLDQCHQVLQRETSIRWLLPVHLYGHAVDLEALEELQARFELTVVEDCAQSILARSGQRPTGTVGKVAATSFYPTKNLGALGDAGAVLTNDSSLAAVACALRNYGQTSTYVHDHLGLNSRLDELHAAILTSAILPHLEDWTSKRRAIACAYREGIKHPNITIPPAPPHSQSVWHLFPVLVPAPLRQSLITHLGTNGIQTGFHYPRLIPEQTALRTTTEFEVFGDLANARRFTTGEVSLPINPFLSETEVVRVIDACNSWRP